MSHVQPAFFTPKCTHARYTFFKTSGFKDRIMKQQHNNEFSKCTCNLWSIGSSSCGTSGRGALCCTRGQWDVTAQQPLPSLLLGPTLSWGCQGIKHPKLAEGGQISARSPKLTKFSMYKQCLFSVWPQRQSFHHLNQWLQSSMEGKISKAAIFLGQQVWTEAGTEVHDETQCWVQPIQAVAHPTSWESVLSTATLNLRQGNSEHLYSTVAWHCFSYQFTPETVDHGEQHVTYLNKQHTAMQLLEKT